MAITRRDIVGFAKAFLDCVMIEKGRPSFLPDSAALEI
jgi:hypothetical protein